MSEAPPDGGFKDSFYERYWSSHVAHRKGEASLDAFRRRGRVWQKHFAALLPADRQARIVDVGCGLGALVWWLQQRRYERVTGIDISDEQLAIARELGVRGVVKADLRSFLAEQPERFDVIILRDVVEHFPRREIVHILGLSRKALRPGGRVILQVPNAESPFFGRIRYGDFTHELAFSSTSVVQVLNMVGFDHIEVRPVPPVAETPRGRLRMPLWKLVETFYKGLLFAELGRGGQRIVTQDLIAVAQRPVEQQRNSGWPAASS